jgi:hypothetical protein
MFLDKFHPGSKTSHLGKGYERASRSLRTKIDHNTTHIHFGGSAIGQRTFHLHRLSEEGFARLLPQKEITCGYLNKILGEISARA